MNISKRFLSMFLVLCMFIGLMPMTALAGDVASQADASAFIRVFHLDCGRKYFTVDQVKELIDAISAANYTHMELAVGNDGLRLLLNDMSVEANGTVYSGDTVKSGIKAGNKAYAHAGEWSQTEMDTIIAYAQSKNIEIIPLINTPGHMNVILAAMKACGIDGYYKTSATTVDLENSEAVAFTQALVMKYAKYFKSQGCTYFNLGADEYANDYHTASSSGMGFGYLVSNNKYSNFVAYVNDLVGVLCTEGLTPIAFNDGIYYNNTTSQGTFDTRLVVASWTAGWDGIKPASTTFLANKGHKILNTNERWYYVLGRTQSSNSTYCYESALSNAEKVSVATVTDNTGVAPMGAMQCVWCDTPSVDYSTYKTNVTNLITALSANNTGYFVAVEKEEAETVTKTDESTAISVAAPGLTGLTVTPVTEKVPVVSGAAKVLAWDMTLATADGDYTDSAVVSVPVPEGWNTSRLGAFVVTNNVVELLTGRYDSTANTFTFTMPHFSVGGIMELAETAIEGEDKVEVGSGTAASYVLDTNGIDDNAKYIVVYNGNAMACTGNSTFVSIPVTENSNGTLTFANGTNISNAIWVRQNSGLYSEAQALYLRINYNELTTQTQSSDITFSSYDDCYYVYRSRIGTDYYLRYNNGWTYTSGSSNATRVKLYKYTESTQTYDVTPTLQESRISAYTVSNAGYTDETWAAYQTALTAAQAKLTTVKTTSYASETAANTALNELKAAVDELETAKNALAKAVVITINYVDEDDKVVMTGTKNVAENASSVTLTSPVYDDAGNTYVLDETTLTLTLPGTTTYTVKVTYTDVSLEDVRTVPVYFWITSLKITANGATEMVIRASDTNVFSKAGAALTDLIPATGSQGNNDSHKLWHVRLQHEGNVQTTVGNDDKTAVGERVEYIRYYAGKWQVKDVNGTWLDIAETDQLTAYYLMLAPLTDEVDSLVKDWGFQFKDGQKKWDYFDESSYVALSAQVIYEDATMNPADDSGLIDTTFFFNYWKANQDGHATNRDIGFYLAQINDDFEVYKITTMHGSCSVTASSDNASAASVNYGNPAPNHADEVIVWQESDGGDPQVVGEDGNTALQWSASKDAILIRIYLRAKVKDDNLTVIYYDEKFDDTLYTYNINVDAGVNFKNGITPTPGTFNGNSSRIDVTGSGIKNIKDVVQEFQTDLSKVPEAVGKYNNKLYTYTGSVISDDGKTLYLYYTINTSVLEPNYVIDFGLPFEFSLDAITDKTTMVNRVTCAAKYGTLVYDESKETFKYTPTQILPNIDILSIGILFDGEDYITTTNVGVTPATTVYYNESFIKDFTGEWEVTGTSEMKPQATVILGESDNNNFGYDSAYANQTGASNGTSISAKTIGDNCTFTFTGTGIQVFANCTKDTGRVAVTVKNFAGKIVSMSFVDTIVTPGTTDATTGQTGAMYGLPIVSLIDLTNMPHDQYTVTITKILDEAEPVSIDGIRVFGTIKDSSIFKDDMEDNPEFYELRDMVLNAIGIKADNPDTEANDGTSQDYDTLYEQVYDAAAGEVAIITDESVTYGNSNTIQDLLDNGPKNELFLTPGQTLTFKVETNRVMQIGLKAPQNATTVDIVVTTTVGEGDEAEVTKNYSVSSSVDMFYSLADKVTVTVDENGNTPKVVHTVQITNPDPATSDDTTTSIPSGLLSVTLLKICDDPNAAFVPLDAEDIANILGVEVDEDIEDKEPEEDVKEEEPEEDEKVEIDFENDEWFWDMLNLVNSKFAIIAEAYEGGSISKEGVTYVKYYNRITYTITPDEGYEVESVIVDGEDVGAVRRYTFRQVKDDHTISVKFKAIDEAAE